ncbi:MAG: pyrroline-5-carboxylate reductase [Deltaproteobacteria bacterium RBG_13_52_11b]|nr:MAG: pyrroline-5-carboxylate reductase [Deltaproteobacteria bacterium RBG_13_52_11b]
MLKNRLVGILGSGNMGEALIKGLLHGHLCRPEQIFCSDVRPERLKAIGETYGIKGTSHNLEVVRHSEIIILSVKPQIMKQVIGEIAKSLDLSKLIISIAAGVPLHAIESCAKRELKLIRVMPNICVSVREGVSAIAAGRNATQEDAMVAKTIFDSVGTTRFIEENLLDAVTGLSGSGPAYIFLIIDALADAGVKVGLSRNDALTFASQTVLGAAKMLIETGEHPGRLKDMVTSPGGTSIAGLHTLEQGGLRATLINAVEVATHRARALGEAVKNDLTKE